jgi:dTDP-4-dehydrorhamnose 3,5-epimerase
MKFLPLPLDGAYLIDAEPFQDTRGLFSRLFCKEAFQEIGHAKEIMQINYSVTKEKGTVRGLHYQKSPYAEMKMVQCLRGRVFDVIVDIRKASSTFLQWHGVELGASPTRMLYVPEGFAHGFQTVEENSELLYFHTACYNPHYESGIRYNDPLLHIQWPLHVEHVSDRDGNHPLLDAMFKGFEV